MDSRLFRLSLAVLLPFCILGCGSPRTESSQDRTLRYTLSGEACAFADSAEYGLWIPGGEKPLKGVIVLQHGCTMEQFGVTRPYDLQYQAFARKWNLAILETALHGDCRVWTYPESGSAEALMKALARAAGETERPELATVPWLIWGHSGGGHWALAMLREYPERILAAVCYSAAFDPQWDYSPASSAVPVLLRYADRNEYPDCKETAKRAFDKLRAMDAPVSIVENKGETHNYSRLRHMMLPFFESAIRERLPRDGGRMRETDPSRSWLGDTLTFEVFPEKGYRGDKSGLCRFPDESSARAWKEYATTNDVLDRTAPPSPYDIKTVMEGDSLVVSWRCEADPESGISCLNVYLDGSAVARVPGEGEYQSFNLNGDNTYPADPPGMRVTLPVPGKGRRARICVENVNQAGLSSKASCVVLYKTGRRLIHD